MTESDLISRIQSLATRHSEGEAILRQTIRVLSNRLVEACRGARIYAGSGTCSLEQTSPDTEVYGYIYFQSESGIRVASRSSDEQPDPEADQIWYRTDSIEECEIEWLRSRTVSCQNLSVALRDSS